MLLHFQSFGFIFHNRELSSLSRLLLFFKTCSSLIPLKMRERERPPYIKHCKHFTQRNIEVIYSLQSAVSGFKASISKTDHKAQIKRHRQCFFCATVHNCIFVCRLHTYFRKLKCLVLQQASLAQNLHASCTASSCSTAFFPLGLRFLASLGFTRSSHYTRNLAET